MTDSPDDALRIGTQEREEAIAVLGEHFSAGRLAVDEFHQRSGTAADAVTLKELRALFTDLPMPKPSFLPPPQPPAPPPPAMAPPGYVAVPPAQYQFSPKSKVAAGVLNIVLPFGIGRFYAGNTGIALAQLLVTIFTLGVGAIWPFIDGIVLLINGGVDEYGRPLRD